MLSVVIPAFNEQEMVPAAAGQIDGILSRAGIPHELIFIDDGSRDATWAEIRALCDDGVKYGCASVCIPASYVKQAASIFRAISARRPPFLPACRRQPATVSP